MLRLLRNEAPRPKKGPLTSVFPIVERPPKHFFSLFETHVSKIRILHSHFKCCNYSEMKLRGPKKLLNLSFPNNREAHKTLFSLFENACLKKQNLRSHFNVAIIQKWSSEAQKKSLKLSFPNSREAPKTLFSLFEAECLKNKNHPKPQVQNTKHWG